MVVAGCGYRPGSTKKRLEQQHTAQKSTRSPRPQSLDPSTLNFSTPPTVVFLSESVVASRNDSYASGQNARAAKTQWRR